MDEGSFEDFLQNAFLAMFENMRSGAAAYIFHADSEGLAFRRAFRDAGFKLAECLIWEKNSFVLGRQDYQWRHEPILYGWKEALRITSSTTEARTQSSWRMNSTWNP